MVEFRYVFLNYYGDRVSDCIVVAEGANYAILQRLHISNILNVFVASKN